VLLTATRPLLTKTCGTTGARSCGRRGETRANPSTGAHALGSTALACENVAAPLPSGSKFAINALCRLDVILTIHPHFPHHLDSIKGQGYHRSAKPPRQLPRNIILKCSTKLLMITIALHCSRWTLGHRWWQTVWGREEVDHDRGLGPTSGQIVVRCQTAFKLAISSCVRTKSKEDKSSRSYSSLMLAVVKVWPDCTSQRNATTAELTL
jgi:hypothetical protein